MIEPSRPPYRQPSLKPAETSFEGVRIATAGWVVPRAVAEAFPAEGTGLERYAARLNAVEINSTFYLLSQP